MTNYLSITEKAAIVRKSLKEIGITSKQVSVKSAYCGYSDKLSITIKDLTVNKETVEKVAKQFEEYERDERSGEILEGGNTYVFIDFDYQTLRSAAEEMMPKAKEIFSTKSKLEPNECEAIRLDDEMVITYAPCVNSIRLTKYTKATDPNGSYINPETLSNHAAWNEHDIAAALGFWKYQYNINI